MGGRHEILVLLREDANHRTTEAQKLHFQHILTQVRNDTIQESEDVHALNRDLQERALALSSSDTKEGGNFEQLMDGLEQLGKSVGSILFVILTQLIYIQF